VTTVEERERAASGTTERGGEQLQCRQKRERERQASAIERGGEWLRCRQQAESRERECQAGESR
jgi:hypothetical protein